jgi:hypothetical protein
MKFYDTHFDDYITSNNELSLHPKLNELYETFPKSLNDLNNLIFYGPKGVGKYTQVLASIKQYSPTALKYEKKISVNYNKNSYLYKISDIHFEIDMSLLGCNAKLLWNEVYIQIIDIILAKPKNIGIIVCKYFQEIHSELLDTFYSYMQTQIISTSVKIKFILITEELSFIPSNIYNCCKVIKVPRPSRILYNKCLKNKLGNEVLLSSITNMKSIIASINQVIAPYEVICNKLIDDIVNINELDFLKVRDNLYNIFIYNMDVHECIWYINNKLISTGKISGDNIKDILIKTYTFLRFYNNNYRPIYHLESYIYFLAIKVNGL